MKMICIWTSVIGTFLFLMFSSLAYAEDETKYWKLSVGSFTPHTLSESATECGFGSCASGGFDISFDTGWLVSAAVGQRYSPYFGVEIEAVYAQAEYNNISGGVTFTGLVNGTISGTAAIDGDIQTYSGIVSGYLYPRGGEGKFEPYIGAGLGYTHHIDTIDSVIVAGTTLSGKETSNNLSYHAKIGFDYAYDDSSKIGLNYLFSRLERDDSFTEYADASSISGTVKFKF